MKKHSRPQPCTLHATIDTGMAAPLRRALVNACGTGLESLCIEPISHSHRARVALCLASRGADPGLDEMIRALSRGEARAPRRAE